LREIKSVERYEDSFEFLFELVEERRATAGSGGVADAELQRSPTCNQWSRCQPEGVQFHVQAAFAMPLVMPAIRAGRASNWRQGFGRSRQIGIKTNPDMQFVAGQATAGKRT
jgi:hypothetical protein